MSVKRRRQQGKEKAELEEQEQKIRQLRIQDEQNQKRVWPDFGGRAFQTNHKTVG